MKLSQTESAQGAIPQATETTRLARRRATSRALRIGALVGSTTLLLACGPQGGSWTDGGEDDVSGGPASTGGADAGGAVATGGGSSAGGSTYECYPQPQQTYICAGYAYENELAGAAELTVYPDVCGEQGGSGGSFATGGAGTGGSFYYGGEGGYYYYDEPGLPTDGSAPPGVGGALVSDDGYGGYPVPGPGGAPPSDDGYGGYPVPGAGGGYYYPAVGGSGSGGSPSAGGASKWCESDPEGTVIGGISFAVGSCQDVDVALPLLLKETYYGSYTAHVYGSNSACDRAVLLTTVAGIGTGQVLEIPFRTEGYSFISVEVLGDRYSEFGIRLRDRPRVVPSSGK